MLVVILIQVAVELARWCWLAFRSTRPLELNEPLMAHRHLSELAGRELTKAAIDDIITRGTIGTWRKLIQAVKADKTGRITRRVTDMAQTLGKRDPKARAFASLLRKLSHKPH